jgi:hypothetical protein
MHEGLRGFTQGTSSEPSRDRYLIPGKPKRNIFYNLKMSARRCRTMRNQPFILGLPLLILELMGFHQIGTMCRLAVECL